VPVPDLVRDTADRDEIARAQEGHGVPVRDPLTAEGLREHLADGRQRL
jgi:hypothetical protein